MTSSITSWTGARLRLAPTVLLAGSALLAGCGSTGTTPASGGPTAGGSPGAATPVSTPVPTAADTASAPTTPPASAVVPSATIAPAATPSPPPTVATSAPAPSATLAENLAAMIPPVIGGNKMLVEPASDSAGSFLILWGDKKVAQDLLARLGKTEKDVSIVYSYPKTNVGSNTLYVNAYRVKGADGKALLQGMVDAYQKLAPGVVKPMTVAGKQVTAVDQPGSPPDVAYYWYAVGDVVFQITAQPREWGADTLSKLP